MLLLSPTEEDAGGKRHVLSHSKSLSDLSLFSPPPTHPSIFYGSASITPPGYLQAHRPSTNITYTFTPNVNVPNCMVLSPPSYVGHPHSPYWISVSMNCFTPSSYITTIRRSSLDGELVGDFELGISAVKKPTLCIRGNEYFLSDVLESNHRLFRNAWCYRVTDTERTVCIYWDEMSNNGAIACFSSKDKTVTNLLARFLPPVYLRKQGRSQQYTRLEVTPIGHDFLDDIVMSALIIERMRTTPSVRGLPKS
ncbi:hypothetical protein AMATHDRAFT_4696 [Amanita thiersii Skay4041]|uniref:DUF6593 domain-containing protein n=1 Tax=Amanita thiersii Skay4041 TaxID=703135 RepID=A0A2A9NPP5_9AGAR|nr:hypothetical protein AMATHDRAFT_4696 [Amanita thiersii Skay4041]